MHENTRKFVKFSTCSVKGLRYEKNEDSLMALAEHNVFAVADGMGGRNGGAVASNLIKESLTSKLSHEPNEVSEKLILKYVQTINQEIYNLSLENAELKGMGSTLSLLSFNKNMVNCIHVGDSRIYRLLNFQLEQMSIDHTKNAHDLGRMSDKRKPQSGITRAMGVKPKVKLDCYSFEHIDSAEYLLVTDGVTDLVADFEIANILTTLQESYNKRVKKLVNLAVSRGGSDDKTVIFLSGHS